MWEYLILSDYLAELKLSLHEAGQIGWELVSVVPNGEGYEGYTIFLKRRVNYKENSIALVNYG